MHQRVQIARIGDDVVVIVGRQVAVADTAKIRCDDLEARRGQRLDVAPPDPLGLRIAVDQQQWRPADSLVNEGQRNTLRDNGLGDVEGV